MSETKPKHRIVTVDVDVYGAEANRKLAEHHKGGFLHARVYPFHAVRCLYKSKRANFTCTCGAEELWQEWHAKAIR